MKLNTLFPLLCLTTMLLPFGLPAIGQEAGKNVAYEIKYLELRAEDKRIYLKGQNTPYSGHGVEKYKSGRPKFQVQYLEGIQHGFTIIWWENGKHHTQQFFNQGKPDGKTTFWYESGMKKSEADYQDGLQNGWTVFWYKSGRKKSAQFWNKGRKTGDYKEWNNSGELGKEPLKLEGKYNDGEKNGTWKYYRSDGSVQYEYQLENGKMKRIRGWDEAGKLLQDTVVGKS